jgi:SAM-dependent methyltransferase
MGTETSVARHWGKHDVFERIVAALETSGKSLDSLTIEDLAPVDHFHARGFAATVDLADKLPIEAEDDLLDIGSGLGGPARYLADRFNCRVTGIDLTPAFVEAAERLTGIVGMEDDVAFEQGDGQQLPYRDDTFDGVISQHVTMNVENRSRYILEAFRVLKPGGFFALTEHGRGPNGDVLHPVPWSEDGSGEHLLAPSETLEMLDSAGFEEIVPTDTAEKYLMYYRQVMERASSEGLPPLGLHILMGETAPQKVLNAARNIEERRTHPIEFICRRPSRSPAKD